MTTDAKKLRDLLGGENNSLILRALQQGASRRDVLRILTACGMQATLAGGLASTATSVFAQTPKRGGKIRVAGNTASVSDTLDPAKQSNQTDYVRGTMFYNGLTSLDSRLAPQPALAEEFHSSDATVWTFKLRKGVVFHDGKPLTPADVVYSLMRHKDPATGSKAKALADQIEEVKATGPNEIRVKLTSPNADFPVVVGTFHFHIVKDGTKDFSKGIGTGPYKCKEFNPGVRSIGVRNEAYWKPGKPYLDEIEYVGIGDDAARVNALLSGDLQLIGSVNPRSVQRIAQTPGFGIFETPSGQYTDLVMRRDAAPGNNPDFVLAMKYMFDREQMRRAVLLGHGVIGNDQPIDPTNRFYFPGLPQRPYDLDKAKFHLKKSGLAGANLPLVASTAALYSVDIALVLQQTAQKAGLNLDVKRMPPDGYWSNYWMKSPLGFGTVNPRPSADTLFTLFFKSDATWNEAGWKNEKFDQMLLAARAEIDEAKRRKLYADMQVMVSEQGGIGIPMFLNSLDGHTSKLKGLAPMGLGGLMGYSFAEHVWLDA
ncbi:ABC transporter substrate-binding protein [Cupriavidus basilensis]|uniref:ABC transporter substrate-binding protein n=1 Tax=Cupriavidus basilensis TaxID=68895 RepID=UPI00157A6802|nr:ABC transporter substrate-binding protein [Cupriavidus basilensis]NUA28469.1 ABC transporter substrate-binding protein [Cupriavidus basilensis]